MWKKGDTIHTGGPVVSGGMRYFNPGAETLTAAGYVWEEPPEPAPLPERYSKLKVIRALGDDWSAYKAQLETAGLLDQFMAAEYLAADDPAFAAFLENVPEEVKDKLAECLWED